MTLTLRTTSFRILIDYLKRERTHSETIITTSAGFSKCDLLDMDYLFKLHADHLSSCGNSFVVNYSNVLSEYQ